VVRLRWIVVPLAVTFVVSLVGAAPVALLAIFTAPLHSPNLMGQVVCPAGSRMLAEEGGADHHGRRNVATRCVTPSGATVARRELDEAVLADAFPLFYPRCFAIVFLIVGTIAAAMTGGIAALKRAFDRVAQAAKKR